MIRSVIFWGPGNIAIEHVPDPEPQPDGLVVRVARCGICGSDVAMTSGSPFDYAAGSRLGHETSGEVVAIGAAVHGVKVGDRVACMPRAGCGKCAVCHDGRPLLCRASHSHGGFSDYVAVQARGAVILPKSLSFADGAMIEPMACGLRALRQCKLAPGERILVLGSGSVALSVVFWARRLGAGKVIVAARSAHRLAGALAFGADAVHSLQDGDPTAFPALLDPPPDIVAECVGKPHVLNQALDYVRIGGRVLSMGMCAHAEPVVPARCALKELALFFPLGYSLEEFEETARILDASGTAPGTIVSDVISLAAVPATIEALRAGRTATKMQVDPAMG